MQTLSVEIWSDIACPWCYVGKRRLEAALARFEHRDAVEITWRAFELDASVARVLDPGVSIAARLGRKYGVSITRAEGMIASMTATAAEDGLDFHFERIRPGNTFDAHRLVHHATTRGLGDAAKERLFRAYLTEGRAMGEVETLVELAGEIGLDADEVRGVLEADTFTADVRADEAEAGRLGISGVPFFVIGRRYGVSGAQPAEALLQVLERAWSELPPPVVPAASGETCGPDGCS